MNSTEDYDVNTGDKIKTISCNPERFFSLTKWLQKNRSSRVTLELYEEFTDLTSKVQEEWIKSTDNIREIMNFWDNIIRPIKRAILSIWDCGGYLKPWVVNNICRVLTGNVSYIDELPTVSNGTYERKVAAQGGPNEIQEQITKTNKALLDSIE